MNKSRWAAMGFGIVLTAGLVTGCQTPTNTNGNANRAVLVNANANTAVVENRNGNRNGAMSREQVERDRGSYERQAKDLGSKIGSGANDLWLWTKTRAALAAADDLRDSTVNVDVDNDVATLTGTVANANQKARAVQVARGVEGVKNVVDKLRVSADGAGNANTGRNRNGR